MTTKREELADFYIDVDLLFLDEIEYDAAIIGVCEQYGCELKVAYNANRIITILMNMDNLSYDDAVGYFENNIIGSYVGEKTPVFVWDIE